MECHQIEITFSPDCNWKPRNLFAARSVTVGLLPLLVVLQFAVRQQLVAHASEHIGRSLGGYNDRLNDGRRNLPKDSADSAGDAFMLMLLNGNAVDVGGCITQTLSPTSNPSVTDYALMLHRTNIDHFVHQKQPVV